MPLNDMIVNTGLSDLQFALIVIGIFLLLLVVIVNVRHARARRKLLDTSHSNGIEPALANRQRHEPSLGEFDDPNQAGLAAAIVLSASKISIDPRIDCVATLRFNEPIQGTEILAEIATWPQQALQYLLEGLKANWIDGDTWENVTASSAYTELQLAVLLANRQGPIEVGELSNFFTHAQNLAEALGAQIDMPGLNAMLDSAKELDALAAQTDIQLSINILFDSTPLTWADLVTLMQQRGFRLHANRRSFEFFNQAQLLFFSSELDPTDPVKQLTFLLELPLVPIQERAFERMLAEGAAIAEAKQGRLVDDNGLNLTAMAVTSIHHHVDGLYTELEQGGIVAGSTTAQRLFS
ncbi:ZipA, C-terminal FtsZ-binding domain containing protein [Burkholderiaceae bacterium]|jgi:hypothetical protein